MKQIIVVSDSHGNNYLLKKIYQTYPNADAYLHLGDSEDYEANLYPFVTVKGNNDYYVEDEYRIIHIGNLNIYMTHGHKMYLSKDNMVMKAKKNHCNVFLFGHTHKPFYEYYEGIYLINPGALSYPRTTLQETFAIISLDENGKVDVEFKQI